MATIQGVLIKVLGNGEELTRAAVASFGEGAVETILHIPADDVVRTEQFTWLRIRRRDASPGNAWDKAYALVERQPFAETNILAFEPDFEQRWHYHKVQRNPEDTKPARDRAERCDLINQDGKGGKAVGSYAAWHLGWNRVDFYSELWRARQQVGDKQKEIVIAHLDTGYDPNHVTRPLYLEAPHNFVADGFPPDEAIDHTPPGSELIRSRGHGTATICLLAGNVYQSSAPPWIGFRDYLGGSPLARIIPVRIADWVVRFTTSTEVQGIAYAIENHANVLSMSMGGLPSFALADAVNLAYEKGLVMVTAAGNNYATPLGPLPYRKIVWPARYRRVIAACGLMANYGAYFGLKPKTMQGNFGPPSKMETAMGAYTPNTPWAKIDCPGVVDLDGAGTSSATPQIAAAAALWLAEHWHSVSRTSQPWMRIEAVRHALFTTAAKSTPKMDHTVTRQKIGQGALRAQRALGEAPPSERSLRKLSPDGLWPWLSDPSFAAHVNTERRAMLGLELMQMSMMVPKLDKTVDDPDLSQLTEAERRRYFRAALKHGRPSRPLRDALETMLGRR